MKNLQQIEQESSQISIYLKFKHGSIEGNKKERFFGTELHQVKN